MDEQQLKRDLKILARFIEVYCQGKHANAVRIPVALKHFDLETVSKRPLLLCPECHKLLAHAFTKRIHCPLEPKPQCKHCENHCYHPAYREKIKEVMAYSGRKLVMHGRLDYLLHLYF